jgi:hypothetical protein
MSEFIQQIINGLSVGAMYALIAIGYTLVYGGKIRKEALSGCSFETIYHDSAGL